MAVSTMTSIRGQDGHPKSVNGSGTRPIITFKDFILFQKGLSSAAPKVIFLKSFLSDLVRYSSGFFDGQRTME